MDKASVETSSLETEEPENEIQSPDTGQETSVSVVVWLCVFAIIVVGVVIRSNLLDLLFLGYDEAMHFQAARATNLADVMQASRIYTHPPLIFLFYHYWLILGDAEWFLRLPSLLFCVPALVFGFLWLKELLGPRPALVGLVFLTFSLPMIHLSIVVRGYTLMLMFFFSALYFQERFFRKQNLSTLIASGICLGLAMLTHYATAWFLLVIGLLATMRVLSGSLSRRSIFSWVVLQFSLIGLCVGLYLLHVKGFVNSQLQVELWDVWLNSSSTSQAKLRPAAQALIHAADYLKYVAGLNPILMGCLLLVGAFVLLLKGYRDSGSKWIAVERCLTVILPMVIAALLLHYRLYPLGFTRHSIWLIPFTAAGFSAAAYPLLRRPGIIRSACCVFLVACWVYIYPYQMVRNTETTQTPAMAREVVSLLKSTIPSGSLIITDGSTRNMLEYYLVGRGHTQMKSLEGGFTEYQMGDYRVVTVPKFHFYLYEFKDDWDHFQQVLGEDATKPLWLTYIGFKSPLNTPQRLFRKFPPRKVLEKANYLDNYLFKLEFIAPEADTKKTDAVTLTDQ
ncbi:MAG: glycosyltransferase family 39 protein [Planctomycetaceae bacterium]|nr:glycosyltransferase family 39 protein [Planctomycetaceae bacterium]